MHRDTLALIDLCSRSLGLSPARPGDFGPGLDWGKLIEAANRHKVAGLALNALSRADSPAIPPAALTRLKLIASAKAAVKWMLVSEWRKIERSLHSAGLRVLVMKGPALSLQLYGDPLAREFRDIDLLVDNASMKEVKRVFFSLGYEAHGLAPPLNPRFEERLKAEEHHAAFKKKGFPVFFEVHGTKGAHIGLAPIGVEDAFAHAECPVWEGTPFPTLNRGQHGRLVLIHGAKHEWCQLQWVLDALGMLKYSSGQLHPDPKLSWRGIDLEYASESFAVLAGKLFEPSPLAQFVLPGGSRSARAKSLANYAEKRFAESGSRSNSMGHHLSRCLFYLPLLNRTFEGKAKAISPVFTPNPNDFLAFGGRLPLFAYFFLRPFLASERRLKRFLCQEKREINEK